MIETKRHESIILQVLVRHFGKHIQEMLSIFNPNFLVPLETKGAILLEMSLETMRYNSRKDIRIIYPRSFNYIKDETLMTSRFLIVDDSAFTCKSLRDVRESLLSRGVLENNIKMCALLDFTCGDPGTDYHDDIYHLISFPNIAHLSVTRDEALQLIHNKIITERIPSTYDHLLFTSEHVASNQYEAILANAGDLNRLLDYGRRGAFFASSILLDDFLPGKWDFPPKIRLWYNPEQQTLRAAPIAAPKMCPDKSWLLSSYNLIYNEISNLFDTALGTNSEDSLKLAAYDTYCFTARMQIAPVLKAFMSDCPVLLHLDRTHLDRYFPIISEQLIAMVDKCYSGLSEKTITTRSSTERDSTEPFGFLGAAKQLLTMTKEAYEVQSKQGKLRKDFITQGFTGQEVLEILKEFTHEQIHSAIDYCFDMNYVAAFLRKNDVWARAMRTTETQPQFHHAEIYGATVVYSQTKPTPAWMLAKVFPIVTNTGGGCFDGIIVCKKGPFGDYCNVVMSEAAEVYWRDVPSDLWYTEGKDTEKTLQFRRRTEKENIAASISRNPKIAAYRTSIEAALFLMNQFGRNGAILLNRDC